MLDIEIETLPYDSRRIECGILKGIGPGAAQDVRADGEGHPPRRLGARFDAADVRSRLSEG